jgi:hypothetical protein
LVLALLSAVVIPALVSAPAQAGEIPTIGTPNKVPELNAYVSQGTKLLDAHLSPSLDISVDIGWQTNTAPTDRSPAAANLLHTGFVLGGHTFNKRRYCQVAVNESLFAALTDAGQAEVITHELFHCYEMQLLSDSDYATATQTEGFMIEGLARWVDVTLFASNPVSQSIGDIEAYFASSTVPLFGRTYDAVGFWGHRQDVVGDLWSRIPEIIRAGANGKQAVVSAALDGVNPEDFFSTWGSSAADIPAGGAEWTATSPYPDGHFSAKLHPIMGTNPESTVSVKLDAYSTNQLQIGMPTPPANEIETAKIDLGGAYGRFGVAENYTAADLKDKTFCAGGSQCNPPTTPTECPGGGEATPPPSDLTPLPENPILAVASAESEVTVTITYAPISEPDTAGICPPPTATGDDGGNSGGSGGDPHFTDFHGDLFDFQAAGQYTLLQSTTDDLQVQVRQVQIPRTSVAVNNEVAMRDAKATVEVDATSDSSVSVYVNRKHVGRGSHSLSGGGSLSVARDAATVHWPDGTVAKLQNATNGPSLKHLVAALWFTITVAKARQGHLTGLLGDAGGPEQTEFASRGGTVYPATQIIGTDTTTLYGAFGTSWRVTNKKASLFRSTKPGNLHAFHLKGANSIFAELLELLQKSAGKVQKAAKTCNKHQFANGAALDACEVDVAETGNPAFVGADATLDQASAQDVAANPPPAPPTPPPPPTAPALPAGIALGTGDSPPRIAYDPASGDTYVAWVAEGGSSLYLCTLPSGASGCASGGPQTLSDPLAGSGVDYFEAQVLVLGGKPVVLAEALGAAAAAVPSGYPGGGVVAWSAATAGGTLAVDNGGKLLASSYGDGDLPSAGAVALGTTAIAVAGNHAPFGNGFTDFTPTTGAPATTPEVDNSGGSGGDYGDQLDIDGEQVAAVPASASTYTAVVIGAYVGQPPGCTTATGNTTGYGVAVGTPAQLVLQSAWNITSAGYFKPISCDAFVPVLAGGVSGIGVLEDEGPGLYTTGSDGVYYRAFNTTLKTFPTPVLVSDETMSTLDGADSLSVSQDSTGGIYAAWADGRGVTLAYSSNGGANWTTPFGTGLGETSSVGDPVVVGVGGATAEVAYDSGSTEEMQVVPAADINFVP